MEGGTGGQSRRAWVGTGEVIQDEVKMEKFQENRGDKSEASNCDNTVKVLDQQTLDNVPYATEETSSMNELSTVEEGISIEEKYEVSNKTSGFITQEYPDNLGHDEEKGIEVDTEDMNSIENVAKNWLDKKDIHSFKKTKDENEEWSSMEISSTSSGISPNHSTGKFCKTSLTMHQLTVVTSCLVLYCLCR